MIGLLHCVNRFCILLKKLKYFEIMLNIFEFSLVEKVWNVDSSMKISFHEHTVLEFQFRSLNYMLVAKLCKKFEQSKPCW